MPSVTQRIDNYLGGVSRQSDDKKLPGQVRECLNGYPDPTFGLTKRPGLKWIANLGSGTTYDSCKWFYIARDATNKYIGCITPKPGGGPHGTIAIWNTATGAACTVTETSSDYDYLTGARTNYHILNLQDTTIITNNLITANKQADPAFVANKQATLVLSGSSFSTVYTVVVAGQTVTHTSGGSDSYATVLGALKTAIDALSISGLTTTVYQSSLQLTKSAAFTITATGGSTGASIGVFQDQVDNITQVPSQTFHGHTVKVINTASLNDTYTAKFIADNGTSGPGYWGEAVDPSKSVGLDAATMPHELVNTGTNAFTFRKATWTARAAGDDVTNPHPSFVGNKIQKAFYHNNRLGFLSEDNVSMGQSGLDDRFNFYFTSAQTITDADPIDKKCSTIQPAALHAVIPTTQGLVLFSKDQQFLLTSADGVLTPSTTTIRTISSYEVDTDIDPVDIGTNINFISKTPSYTRIFGMVTRGQDENPQVVDVGRIVNEWVPATVDTFIASPQNQFLALSGQSSNKVYFYRTYGDGDTTLVQAWFNWQLPGTVQAITVDSDDFYTVTKQGTQFTLSKASLSQSPEDAIIVSNQGQKINPCMDLYAAASSVVYDSTNLLSKCYIPWDNITGLTPVIVIKGSTAAGQFVESGFTTTPSTGSDGTGAYFSVPSKNLTSVAADVVVGWKYDFDVTLPKTYFRLDDNQTKTDFTANLTVARMKFAVGLSGVMGFKLKSTGVRQGKKEYTGDGSTTDFNWIEDDISYVDRDQIKVKVDNVVQQTADFTFLSDTSIRLGSAPGTGSTVTVYLDEWYNLSPTQKADTYLANDIALSEQSVFTLPIHQKTENFQVRLFNDSPFPVSLNSMMWEGNYSPRFYRRA